MVYDTLTIWLGDDDIMSITIGDVNFDLTNNPHVSAEDPHFDVMNDSFSQTLHHSNKNTKTSNGWYLTEYILSYWEFGEKFAEYDLPQTEILEFSTNCFGSSSDETILKKATLVTQDEIILADKDNLQTIPMENMFHYYFTNNGYIFYVTKEHDMYQIDIHTGETQLKNSDVFCITEFKGWGDGGHSEVKYVTMDGKTRTDWVAM